MIPVTTSTLGDIGKVCMCKRIMKEQTSPVGDIPFYKISTFGDKADCYISREVYEDYKTRFSFPKKGDILISAAGTLGRTVIYEGEDAFFQDSNIVWIDNDESKVLNEYLYYFYMTNPWVKTFGSTIPRLYNDNIRSVSITYPTDIEDQKNVVRIMKTIDSKIDNNNAICSNLEAMAKLLYDYWFVQFDFPDENGKPYKSSGGKMVWNDDLKREIPAGWEVKPLGEYISVIRGISYKPTDELKQSSANSISLLKSNNIQNGTINYDQPVFLPIHLADNSQWLTEGSVFITMSSGSKAHMGKTAIVYKDLPYVFGAFCAKIGIDDSVRGYLSTYFRSEWFRAYIENVTAGTSINNIGNDQLTSILLPFPGSDIQKRFEGYLKPMFVRQGELGTETQQLVSLRDFLLPMLMNGQVKVMN